jgi:hypothetical protein
MVWFFTHSESLVKDFIDDGPNLEELPIPWRRFEVANVDEIAKESGSWDDVVAAVEERYTSEGSSSTHCITEDVSEKRLQVLGPEITTAIKNITRLPTDDRPLWRIRCKVVISYIIFQSLSFVPICLGWLRERNRFFFTSVGCPMASDIVCLLALVGRRLGVYSDKPEPKPV